MKNAPQLFDDYKKKILRKHGFVSSTVDNCFYKRRTKSGIYELIVGHVDDDIIATKPDSFPDIDHIYNEIYREHKTFEGPDFKWTGWNINQKEDGAIVISQKDYIVKFAEKYNIVPSQVLPKVRPIDLNAPLADPKEYLKLIMSANYVILRPETRIHMELLRGRCKNPTTQDVEDLKSVIAYWLYTKDIEILLKPKDMILTAQVDASFANAENHLSVSGFYHFHW